MIRVVIADGHALLREGLEHILRDSRTIAVVGEACNGYEALTRSRTGGFDVLVLEMSLPGRGGIELIRQLKHEAPSIPILVLTLHEVEQYAAAAFRAGASGFLNKSTSSEQLIAAIHRVASGRPFVNPAVAEQLAFNVQPKDPQLPHIALSEREGEVFTCLLAGDSVKEIAARMGISIKTVSTHKVRMMEKMGLSTVSQLVQYAVQHRLLTLPVN
jgi:DNA-binding NarL/FixJ family response regulator